MLKYALKQSQFFKVLFKSIQNTYQTNNKFSLYKSNTKNVVISFEFSSDYVSVKICKITDINPENYLV